MFSISYLSTDNRRQIETLTKKIEETTDRKESDSLREKIGQLESEKKPYVECTIEELNDLRGQLFEKKYKLAGIGAGHLAQQFTTMIETVEQYMQALAVKAMMEQAAKKKETVVDGKPARPTNLQTKSGRDRWTSRSSLGY